MIYNKKIVDTFLFFNELDLLDVRLNILNDVVDKFVIVESPKTFQCDYKPLFYKNNSHLFKKFHHKIDHRICIDVPKCFTYWEMEWMQRNFILETLQGCNDSDLIFISDLDEIWNPDKIPFIISEMDDNQVYKWGSKICYFYLNLIADEKEWFQPVFLSYSLLKSKHELGMTINDIIQNKRSEFTSYEKISNAGWHFSYLTDPEYKLQSFSHSEHKDKKIDYLMECVKNKINPFHGNPMYVINESEFQNYLPKYLFDRLSQYQKWIFNDK